MSVKLEEVSGTGLQITRWIIGAADAVCVGAMIQLASLDSYDRALQVSVAAFATAIPMLTAHLLMSGTAERHGIAVVAWWVKGLAVVGAFSALTGVGGLFAHVGPLWLVLFGLSAGISSLAWFLVVYVVVTARNAGAGGHG